MFSVLAFPFIVGLQEELLVVGKVGLDEVIRNQKREVRQVWHCCVTTAQRSGLAFTIWFCLSHGGGWFCQADKRLAAREAELEERHRARVEMLEAGTAQLRKTAAFDKDALARSEARAADLQRELASAREVRTYVQPPARPPAGPFCIDVRSELARFPAPYVLANVRTYGNSLGY